MKGKTKHIFKALASSVIWGLGQVFNKQYLKALFFFLFFAILVIIEVGSSKFISGYDPYDKIAGEDFSPLMAQTFYNNYKKDALDNKFKYPLFEQFYLEKKEDGVFSNDELIAFLAMDIKIASRIKYYVLSEEIKASEANKGKDRPTDYYPEEDEEEINKLKPIITIFTTYQSPEGIEYYRYNRGTAKSPDYIFINVNDDSDTKTSSEIKGYKQLDRKNNLYANSDYTKFYLQVVSTTLAASEIIRYDNIVNKSDSLTPTEFSSGVYKPVPKVNDALFYDESNIVFGYYNPESRDGKYRATLFSTYLSEHLVQQYKGFKNQDDFAKLKLRVYFEINPDVKTNFEETYDNFYNDRAGFFLKGLWSIVTLGTAGKIDYYQINNLTVAIDSSGLEEIVITNIYIKGHLSSYLLIKGLISTLLLCYFIIVFIWNIRDAYKTSLEFESTKVRVKDKDYFKKLYESTFEYIVLFPAIFTITFISIMPIIFGFLIAFTSYNGTQADIGLFDWVGFSNFVKIFSFGDNVGIPFGSAFWRVFVWTVIWAIFSTFTVFFGGFFQAVIINSERVPLKKFWRTLLILPWAVPAIISQMVFANIFNEIGVVNAFLSRLGLYDILINWGWLGNTWEQFKQMDIPRLFFLGTDNIQWFSNAHNPWFVRIILIVVNIWLGFPYFMALMTSVMIGIDRTLYEAADIDGANKQQKFRFITFPLVMFSTAPLLVMTFSGNFNNFGVIYFITQGGQNSSIDTAFAGDTDILISWMYTLTVEEKYYNMASVFSILIFFIVGSIAAWNYSRTRSFKED